MDRAPSILFGVTSAQSIKLLGNIPETMAARGWLVHAVCNPGRELNELAKSGIRVHEISMSRNPSLGADLVALVRWFQLIRELRPDVISIGTPKASLLGILASWICRVPSRIYVLRGLRLETTKGTKRTILWLLEALTSGASTGILSVSPSLSRLYSAMKLAAPTKIHLLGLGSSHGVETSHFTPATKIARTRVRHELGLSPKVPVIGFVGRFSIDKGSGTILGLHKHLLALGHKHQMLIVGDVEDSSQEWETLNGEATGVTCVGEVADTAKFYSAMDFLLLPTLREGFPNVVLEAAASGIPVVGTDATGSVDAIVTEKTGLVVPKGDDQAFYAACELLLMNPGLRKKLGDEARAWVSKNFDSFQILNTHMLFYQSQIKDNSRA